MEINTPEHRLRMEPWWGMLLYLAVGAVWVALGDALLAALITDPLWLARGQTIKGWLYVLLTGVLAWWLLRRMRTAEAAR